MSEQRIVVAGAQDPVAVDLKLVEDWHQGFAVDNRFVDLRRWHGCLPALADGPRTTYRWVFDQAAVLSRR